MIPRDARQVLAAARHVLGDWQRDLSIRNQHAVRNAARDVAAAALRQLTPWGWADIAHILGYRSHSSAFDAARRGENHPALRRVTSLAQSPYPKDHKRIAIIGQAAGRLRRSRVVGVYLSTP